jgi:hypothetical protein
MLFCLILAGKTSQEDGKMGRASVLTWHGYILNAREIATF